MANTYPNVLRAGLQASYNAISAKDANVLYFCTDTGKIYKGDIDMSNTTVVAASKPETPVVGKIYFLADTKTVEVFTGAEWKVISYPTVTTINAASDDNHVATAKAVYDAIQEAVQDITGGATIVKDVEESTIEGNVKVTKGDDTVVNVPVKGVVTTPTWNVDSRVLTLPVVGGNAVEVNIGKDIFIDPTAENGYHAETNEIWVYLNDGTEGKESTLIKIPVTGLVDVYTGTTADGTNTTVVDNVIKVELVKDPAANNAVEITENGIKVDLSAYAKTEDVTAITDALQTAVETAQGDADTANAAIEVLNSNSTTEGSVDYKIAQAKAAIDSTIGTLEGRVGTLETDMGTAKTDIIANADNIAALATATTTWGTF